MFLIVCLAGCQLAALAQSKHDSSSRYPTYQGLLMCGYQGWFRAEGDDSGEGWVHYNNRGKFDAAHVHLDFWPDVSEYAKTYPTALTNQNGTTARVFSSYDQSTTDLHFKWMQQYGIDGVFVQRFFGVTRTEQSRKKNRVILGNALKASQKYGRAIAVMYDLSGLKASGEDCSSIIQDWKELVDELKITSAGNEPNLSLQSRKTARRDLGIGFSDRPTTFAVSASRS